MTEVFVKHATPVDAGNDMDIAIIGMAAHLPGAGDIEAYWQNLRDGIESIRALTPDELKAAGESPAKIAQPNYVPAAAILDGLEMFDASFFGFSPKEAAILDPQHRHFLETAWEALENAAHPPEAFAGRIGVWAGCGMGSYFYFNICSNRDLVDQTGMFLLRHTGNDKDFLATRVSHVFDLKGPSINVQTACSTSLVAVHSAVQALLNGECDMALAGGVTIELPHGRGYLYQEGEILSPDGHCHAFDHRAQGTVFGSGAGCVVLRRLQDALADGDHIWAVIKGSAVNNDGASKAGYLAPSVEGQARCIAEAQAVAGVSPDTVSYVECHGTGTYLGDPIEVAALTEAFGNATQRDSVCALGSVKTNIGHLDTAAGAAGLIKVALSLHHRQLPPSLGYDAPNPSIDFAASGFRVNDRLQNWDGPVLRAGVNSLGVGGTNAHVVLQEAPKSGPAAESDWPFQPLVISAKSKAALDGQAQKLAAHLRAHSDQNFADVAYTLKEGRRAFEKRRVCVAASAAEAADILQGGDPRRVFSHDWLGDNPEVVFMFPGGGAQYAGMARDLYETEPVFADWMDRGLAHLQPKLDYDLRAIWLPSKSGLQAADAALKRPSVQLPLIMMTEYALAQLFQSWGVRPAALIGHSMGENTAAALAGVMSFEDCINLVHLRGQLFDSVPAGGMVSVPLSAAALAPYLGEGLDLASDNAPELCVVSGSDAALNALVERLSKDGVECQRIAIDIAAHSRMLEPILDRFDTHLRQMTLNAPQLPIISNRSGQVLSAQDAVDPAYWVAHLRNTVQFRLGIETLKRDAKRVFMEMGPGRAMSSLAQANGVAAGQVIPALRHPEQSVGDDAWHMTSIARLWACGVTVDWAQIWGDAPRRRVPLPSYAFQRDAYFIEAAVPSAVMDAEMPLRTDDLSKWGWETVWQPQAAGAEVEDLAGRPVENWLVFEDEAGLSTKVGGLLQAAGQRVTRVRTGDAFARLGDGLYSLSPEHGRNGYDALMQDLVDRDMVPAHILHAWLVTERESFRPGSSFSHRNIEQGFYALFHLAQALADVDLPKPVRILTLTSGAAQVKGEALAYPEKAMVSGPVRVIPRELPDIDVGWLDLSVSTAPELVIEELLAPTLSIAALRGERRYVQNLRAAALPAQEVVLKQGAHVFITGGIGGISRTIAEDLARKSSVRLSLISRREVPAREQWPQLLASGTTSAATRQAILAVQRLEAAGASVGVIRADVANPKEVAEAKAIAEQRFGRVDMVIHAAGLVDDAPLLGKSVADVEDVFAAKMHGCQVLDRVFPDGSVDWMVLFGSSSTATGPAGQTDYVAANEYLNAYARHRQGGKTKVVALNWGMWQEVGMAAEAQSRRSGTAEPRNLQLPMLDQLTEDSKGDLLFTAHYGFDRWVLDGHRTKAGQALIPGTGYIEVIAEAWAQLEGDRPFEIRDLTFFRALDVPEGHSKEIRAVLRKTAAGYSFDLQSAVATAQGKAWLPHASAEIFGLEAAADKYLSIKDITARLPKAEQGLGLGSPQEAHLAFGPRWRVLLSRSFGHAEGFAGLALPEAFVGDMGEGWHMHPALLDLATGWAVDLIDGYDSTTLWVPLSYTALRLYRALPAAVFSHVRIHGANQAAQGRAVFDVTLTDTEGRILLEVEGFTMQSLPDGLHFEAPDPRSLIREEQAQASSTAEARQLQLLAQAIRPTEGPEAFARALARGQAQIYVCPQDLPAVIRHNAQSEAQSREVTSFARPALQSDYQAPRNALEHNLCGYWQDLLGIDQVGVEDSFFDLGGHSLVAVRLFAMIKKAYRCDFPISILFEAPTIAAIAARIEIEIGPQEGSAATDAISSKSVAVAPKSGRFRHLVAMHRGDGGPELPFFLVAGMFGNVLNLRHLAQQIGADRPFYGLQARGLYGDEPPHEDFASAARDYIAEMRQVQPNGPYLVGGFSGGGLIAWEIARQLQAMGEEVPLLVLLDTPLPKRPELSKTDKLQIRLAEMRAEGSAFFPRWWRDKQAAREAQAARLLGDRTAQGSFHNLAIEAAFLRALQDYSLEPRLNGETLLFRPPLDLHWKLMGGRWVSQAREFVFDDNQLTPYAKDLRIYEVPGDHDSMVLEPNVRVLAADLRRALGVYRQTVQSKAVA